MSTSLHSSSVLSSLSNSFGSSKWSDDVFLINSLVLIERNISNDFFIPLPEFEYIENPFSDDSELLLGNELPCFVVSLREKSTGSAKYEMKQKRERERQNESQQYGIIN